MSISERKQRAWQQRTDLILTEADIMLREGGYLGLNLDTLAERIDYSKATIYNHFQNKEDLILGVAVRHCEMRADLFSRTLSFDGSARERMCAVGVADEVLAKAMPHGFSVMQLARTHSIWEKANPKNHEAYFAATEKCMSAPYQILAQARESGDLPEGSPEDVCILFGLISMAKGSHLLSEGTPLLNDDSGVTPESVRFRNYCLYLDGVGWNPLSTVFDYDATHDRALEELFSDFA
ncbi:TetR/AcrR family transcriptional regulator [Rubellicoccus peritrichatus]|uniref:TetR/AcrR family transcriptional regulator n=1 Tax=Rubellicoccus peritrichatus TaxID=3080537 RepID=A0AAQ3LDM7_9BACT|nr:TetR/AcrR family transcriptional regulator [Puniceicoccus sp. CR14]WOO42489.1 TetR/AcrR family transcriptional regulator [Puniceicoccus sp. CR14]